MPAACQGEQSLLLASSAAQKGASVAKAALAARVVSALAQPARRGAGLGCGNVHAEARKAGITETHEANGGGATTATDGADAPPAGPAIAIAEVGSTLLEMHCP
jgi:hypothetical protein